MYLVYTNPLNNLISNPFTKTYSYSDDVALVVAHDSLEEAEKIMQANWNSIVTWSHDQGLAISETKTKIMHIHSPQFATRPIQLISHSQLCIHTNLSFDLPCQCSDLIETVTEAPYLGVKLDMRFKFDVHTDYLNSKLRSISYIMFQLRTCLSAQNLRAVYCALVESVVRYGLLSWGNTTKTYLDTVQRQQKRILKAISGRNIENRQEPLAYFRHFNVLPAEQLFKFVLIMSFRKNNDFRGAQEHGYGTRGVGRFIEARYTNEYGRQMFEHTVPALFNRLPERAKEADSISDFKKQVKLWLLDPPGPGQ